MHVPTENRAWSLWHAVATRRRAVFGATVAAFLILTTINLGTAGSDTLLWGSRSCPSSGVSVATDGLEGFLGPMRVYEEGFTYVFFLLLSLPLLSPLFVFFSCP